MDKTTSNSTLELEDKIFLLVRRALYLLERAEKIAAIFKENKIRLSEKMKYSYPNHPKMKYIVVHHNLYVNEAAIILATVLSNDKKEISLKRLLLQKEYITDCIVQNDVSILKIEYGTSNSKKIRDKIAAHKEDGSAEMGAIFGTNLYTSIVREELLEFLKKIEKICFENFCDPTCNSDFDYYRDSDIEIDNFLSSVV